MKTQLVTEKLTVGIALVDPLLLHLVVLNSEMMDI